MQVSKEIFSSPEHKLLPTLALYELPKLRETPYEHTGLTWYENIKLALVNRGVPEIAFRLEMEGVGLHGLLNKFRYRRLQEISDEKLADELLSNTVQGPDEHPFGDTVSGFTPPVGNVDDSVRIRALIDSWTTLTPTRDIFCHRLCQFLQGLDFKINRRKVVRPKNASFFITQGDLCGWRQRVYRCPYIETV